MDFAHCIFVCNLYHSFLPRCGRAVCALEDLPGFDRPLFCLDSTSEAALTLWLLCRGLESTERGGDCPRSSCPCVPFFFFV